MVKRTLLLQAPGSRVTMRSALADAGWEVRPIGDPQGVVRSAGEGCLVGIAVIDAAADWPAASLQEVALHGPREWIAVLPREALDRPALRRAIVDGFYDFHTLPVDLDRLLVVLGRAFGKAQLAAAVTRDGASSSATYGMVGRSPGMIDLYRGIEKVARLDTPVLISGESGTGKETAARAIHRLSARGGGPFVAVNCGSLPVGLVHSELFGHERGSGARRRKIGSVQAADRGILFLDEIGDLPLELQSRLLRFLQEKTIARIGATESIAIDARLMAASHVDLWQAVNRGRFREDLYYRLNVLHLHIPALRDRLEDVPLLAQSIFESAGRQKSAQVAGFSDKAIAAMRAYAWPGNVRELMNRVQKAMLMCEYRLITPEDMGLAPRLAMPEPALLRIARGRTERALIGQTLLTNGRNVAATARQLGVSRTTLYRLLQKFEIDVRMPGLPDSPAAPGKHDR